MKTFMYQYERVGTCYTDQKLLIFADSQKEADIKAIKHMRFLERNSKYEYEYKINMSCGEICGLDIHDLGEGYTGFYGVKQENDPDIAQDVTKKYNNVINAFAADFELAVEKQCILSDLNNKIVSSDKNILDDIDTLSELAYSIRHGVLKIMKADSLKENS